MEDKKGILKPEDVKHGDVVSWMAVNGPVNALAKKIGDEIYLFTDDVHNFPVGAIVTGMNPNIKIIAHVRVYENAVK